MPILDYLVPTICLPIQQQRVPLTSESYITCLVYTHTHRLFQSLSYFLSHSLSFISFPFRWPIHTHRGTLTSTFTLSHSLTLILTFGGGGGGAVLHLEKSRRNWAENKKQWKVLFGFLQPRFPPRCPAFAGSQPSPPPPPPPLTS